MIDRRIWVVLVGLFQSKASLVAGIFMRNAFRIMRSSRSAAAVVTKYYFNNIPETAKTSNFKIEHITLDGLCISTGSDVISYFRSAANHINGFIFGNVQGRDLSRTFQSISEKIQFCFGKDDSSASVRRSCFWTPKCGKI